MKSTTTPSLRVEPEFHQTAESALREGETLSSFMEEALRAGIQHRKIRGFIARGLTSLDGRQGKLTGSIMHYFQNTERHSDTEIKSPSGAFS